MIKAYRPTKTKPKPIQDKVEEIPVSATVKHNDPVIKTIRDRLTKGKGIMEL